MSVARICFRYGDRRLFSRLVTFFRGGDSAHCEVSWAWRGDQHYCASSSWVDGGVRSKVIEMAADKWRVYEVELSEDPLDWLDLYAGQGYDFLGLLGILWPRAGDSRTRWFCSEAAGYMLGLPEPQLFDLRTLESVCMKIGKRIQ